MRIKKVVVDYHYAICNECCYYDNSGTNDYTKECSDNNCMKTNDMPENKTYIFKEVPDKDTPTLEEIIKERITSLTKSEQTYKDIDKVLVSICKENRIILESILTEYKGE